MEAGLVLFALAYWLLRRLVALAAGPSDSRANVIQPAAVHVSHTMFRSFRSPSEDGHDDEGHLDPARGPSRCFGVQRRCGAGRHHRRMA
jgi:hypothetical protein